MRAILIGVKEYIIQHTTPCQLVFLSKTTLLQFVVLRNTFIEMNWSLENLKASSIFAPDRWLGCRSRPSRGVPTKTKDDVGLLKVSPSSLSPSSSPSSPSSGTSTARWTSPSWTRGSTTSRTRSTARSWRWRRCRTSWERPLTTCSQTTSCCWIFDNGWYLWWRHGIQLFSISRNFNQLQKMENENVNILIKLN